VMADPFRSNNLTLPRVFDKARHAVVSGGLGDCATGYAEVIPGDLIAPLLPTCRRSDQNAV